ncbi:hypothetical protein Ahy_A07g037070 [Arachis hypogaea]|uniref:Uncharacterized protein n=1 Tax=Arachis hypogaea TaxID=3818 RepID=A0A445CHQ4_ARAHY|nr:hypothetical protein Ahy_A07g037070 [Arachis hypogaea]
MLNDVRQGPDHLTTWHRPDIKKVVLVHWETEKGFRHRCLTNKANRVSARSSKYIGSLATFMKTKDRLSKSLDREATLVEMLKYTYTLKENKDRFADYRLEAATQQSQQSGEDTANGSATSVVDLDVVWREIASVSYKKRVYGLGSFFATSICTSTLRSSSGSITS